MANGTGPSESFLSSYFSNPFKKKRKGDVKLPMPPGGKKDPRLVEGTKENIEYNAKNRKGIFGITRALTGGK